LAGRPIEELTLTKLEADVLKMLLAGDDLVLEAMREQLARAKVKSRKMTGVGFYTYFDVPSNVVKIDEQINARANFQFGDIGLESDSIEHGAGFTLFVRDRVINDLEGHTYTAPWPEKLKNYKLEYIDGPLRDLEYLGNHWRLSEFELDPNNVPKAYTGHYKKIEISFTPNQVSELIHSSTVGKDFNHAIGHFHLFLDGEDAIRFLPSIPLFYLLTCFMGAIPQLLDGQAASFNWLIDTWQFDLECDISVNRLNITLSEPIKGWMTMDQVWVPLIKFAKQLFRISDEYIDYLREDQSDENSDEERGRFKRIFLERLNKAEAAIDEYEKTYGR
jgi:hypothetical protein